MKLKLGSEILDRFGADELQSPLVLSVPHSGTDLTADFKNACASDAILRLPDTDWYVDQIYSFARDLGIYAIKAKYSRYIIDLNRPRKSDPPLYSSRQPTALIPTQTFDGKPIYKSGQEPTEDLLLARLKDFYDPYYEALFTILNKCVEDFGYAILVDCHSIRSQVSEIQKTPFENFILGNRMGKTCPSHFLDTTKSILESSGFSCALNDPFQGGQITRYFQEKMANVFTLQIEMCQAVYMDEQTLKLSDSGMKKTSQVLFEVIKSLLSLVKKEYN